MCFWYLLGVFLVFVSPPGVFLRYVFGVFFGIWNPPDWFGYVFGVFVFFYFGGRAHTHLTARRPTLTLLVEAQAKSDTLCLASGLGPLGLGEEGEGGEGGEGLRPQAKPRAVH